MAERSTTGILILLMVSVMIMGGCGWISGGNDEAIDPPLFSIDSLTPNDGLLPGGESIVISGTFPTIANATFIYEILFGDNAASYEGVYTANEIHVTAPPGDMPGFVDVVLYDRITGIYEAHALNGYEYIDPLTLFSIDSLTPNKGLLPGGESIVITGTFPTIANASLIYRVYFGDNAASYEGVYTANEVHVTAPAGDTLGFVNVALYDRIEGIYEAYAPNGYEYIDQSLFSIDSLTPNSDFLAGGAPVVISGVFPVAHSIYNLAEANDYYSVQFGGNFATFIPDINGNYITATEMYVATPPGDAPGLVDVTVAADSFGTRTVTDGFTYFDDFGVTSIDPDSGHISGNTAVTVLGFFHVANAIYSLAEANADYSVRFDGNLATFVPNAVGQYITANTMYVATPPAALPAIVDVSVVSAIYGTYALYDGYRYFDDFDLFNVDPNRGPVPGGNLVRINGNFLMSSAIYTIAEAQAAYNIYFGSEFATFPDFTATGDPVITNSYMYAIAPPALTIGIVDVNIATVAGIYSAYANVSTPVLNDYEYFSTMELIDIDPDRGPLGGNTAIQVHANLPITADVTSLALANSYYSVEIDGTPATFNTAVSPLIEVLAVYDQYNVVLNMLTPFGTSIGLKDASLIDVSGADFPADLPDAYTYTNLFRIFPNTGPLSGGQEIQVLLNIDVAGEVFDDSVIAESLYQINIDGKMVMFGPQTPFIGMNVASSEYSTYFNMITPMGDSLGIKDGTFYDKAYGTPEVNNDGIENIDVYKYINDDGATDIGNWTDVSISPRPVGALDAGELKVVITVSGQIAPGDFIAFIVPQGGNPEILDHRIGLEFVEISADFTEWTGVNKVPIPNSANNEYLAVDPGNPDQYLFVDGHAAVYFWTSQDLIVGDDITGNFSDGGTIVAPALSARHFLIDTLPPVMVTANADANVFVDPSISDNTGTLPANAALETHPYPLPGVAQPNITVSSPVSTDVITNAPLYPNPGEQSAQQFFNIASISNNFSSVPTTNNSLYFTVEVDFVDYDISSYPFTNPLSPAPDFTAYPDLFDGSTFRQPAGFDQTSNTIIDDANKVVIGNTTETDVQARWVLQGGSTSFPDIGEAAVTYFPTGSLVTGFTPIIADTITGMEVLWDITSGIAPGAAVDPMHLVMKFAAGDRASIYYPRDDTDEDVRAIMTRRAEQLDPLHIWWMREVNTNITRDNIPASGVTQNPIFTWEIGNQPRPELVGNGADPNPLFYYELWESSPSANLEDFRDGDYSFVTNSDWLAPPIASPDFSAFLNPNQWYLFVVVAVDEAGNAERWPSELSIDASGYLRVAAGSQSGGNNWRRFYYPDNGSVIDTVVQFEFWHDGYGVTTGVADANERNFANQTIIPLPPKSQFFNGLENQRVAGRFTATVIGTGTNPQVNWRLFREGVDQTIATPSNFQVLTSLGDPNRINAITYVLTATGSDDNGTDSTPVNIRFTVVPDDDISKFLRNVQSDDNQPIKEFDNP